MNTLTLYELNSLARDAVERGLPGDYRVVAELSEAREVRGNCYMELVQKDPDTNVPVARASAACWRGTWSLVGPYFERVTGQRLSPGMRVLLQVNASFHEAYGFRWIVTDIDPVFTIGDMARKRREIIERLKEEGVLDLNKELELSPFARRVAVISSASAAGYGDFVAQLEGNTLGLSFETELFEAVMQGERVERSVIDALNRINERLDSFDCVVIIRGGGAVSDMSGFDSLALAENVANFPLPVITGIGHERDDTVIDMVAHTRVKTPTAAAALLIDNLKRVLDTIDNLSSRLVTAVERRMVEERQRLGRLADRVPVQFSLVRTRQESTLDTLWTRVRTAATSRLAVERHGLESLSGRVRAADPSLLLRRGYSITTLNGRVLRDAAELKEGDIVETRLKKGVVRSAVVSRMVAKPAAGED